MILTTTILLILLFPILAIIWMKHKYEYWKKRNILTPPFKIGWGHFREPILQKKSFSDTLFEHYRFFKSRGVKHGGLYSFMFPIYIPLDLDIIKSILLYDSDHFAQRGFYMNEVDDPLSATIFALKEDKWRFVRPKVSSAYSPAKLKMMHDTIVKCAEEFVDALGTEDMNTVYVTDLIGAYTMDIIGYCGFGIKCNCLKEPHNEFIVNVSSFFKRTLLENIKIQMTEIAPEFMKKIHTCITKRSVTEFFEGVIKNAMDYREKNNIVTKDSLDILMRITNNRASKNDINEGSGLPFREIVGIAYSLFLGNFETTSEALCFTLYLISIHKDIQEKAREEISRVMAQNEGRLNFESMSDFIYLEMIINESLRIYPPVHHLYRICTKTYRIPGTDLVLEKGQKVFIPALGIQHDEQYYPDPLKFDPERFSPENMKKRNSTTFLPFGMGPKYCLAQRFGSLQVKILLVKILQKFEISLNEQTTSPLEFSTGNHIILSPKEGIWLNFKRLPQK